jgi:hypothetical protein
MSDLIMMLRENGMYVRQSNSDSTSFKLKIVRPAKKAEKSNDPNVIRNPEVNGAPPKTGGGGFMKNLASFPKSFISQLRYRTKYGAGYNKGFNSAEEDTLETVGEQGEIKFYVVSRCEMLMR